MDLHSETPISGRDVAKMLGCCYEYALAMAKRGEIPHFKIGNKIFFRASSIRKWLDEQETNSVNRREITLKKV